MKPHKHAELIKAWADGAIIEVRSSTTNGKWHEFLPDYVPSWDVSNEYRIKPEPKPDVVFYLVRFPWEELDKQFKASEIEWVDELAQKCKQIKVTFDGETGELKSAEVIK